MVAMMAVLGTGGPIAAFATAYGSNNTDVNISSLAGRILEDIDRIIEEEIGDIGFDELPTIPQPISTPPAAFCDGQPATIVGTPGDDNIVGTEGRDVIALLGGDHRIQGLGGDDLICGDEGFDRVAGNEGNDLTFGDDGIDVMLGFTSDDSTEGGAGVLSDIGLAILI
jgi:Ca2+-binding RTX toxin-like protein